ncbi:hypothetical protein E4U54_003753 [Claviceps lovelessii]|nr:hypothetical protein E4U54_003753 [Claviceps lovelessii]
MPASLTHPFPLIRLHAAHLRLQGSDAQNHAVYAELKRVQHYFGKIKAVEEPEGTERRTVVVNQEAAARLLKADLADNKALSAKLAEKIAEERARALLKSVDGRKRRADGEGASAAATESGEDKASGSSKRRQKRKSKSKSRQA